MALTATMYTFAIELSDVDRNVYESLTLKVAQHPSETNEYLVSRVLAYALEYAEGIAFGPGIADPDEPTLAIRDLTGALKVWIDVGAPDAARLHKASKAARRVVVYTHREPRTIIKALAGERIHRAEALELYAFDRDLIASLAEKLDRRMKLGLSVTERHLYVTVDDETVDGAVETIVLPPA